MRRIAPLATAALAAALLAPPSAAGARGGVWFGFGVPLYPDYPAYPAYPVYPAYPGTAYPAAPPPAYRAPPGQACYAGAYICPLDRPVPAGEACACQGRGGLAWGRVGG